MKRVPFTYGVFDFSFKGRKNLAFAHWEKKGRKNVVTFYLNKIWEDVVDFHRTLGISEMDAFICLYTALDFHELNVVEG
jgi:hypothetical protein